MDSTVVNCKCCKLVRSLRIGCAVTLGLTLALGFSMLRRPNRMLQADSIPEQVKTKQLVIVDDSGSTIATLGHQQTDPYVGSSTQLVLFSPSKTATYTLRVGDGVTPKNGGVIWENADAVAPDAVDGPPVKSMDGHYQLSVQATGVGSASIDNVHYTNGQNAEHLANVTADYLSEGMLVCSNANGAQANCHNVSVSTVRAKKADVERALSPIRHNQPDQPH
jgi:hypothetical protein